MAISLENLRKDVCLQKESDKQMSNVWLLVYLLPIGVGIIFSVYVLVSFIDIVDSIYPSSSSVNFSYDGFGAQIMNAWITIGLTGVVNFAVGIVLTYKLVNRRHTHFKRQKFLSEDLIASIKSMGKMKDNPEREREGIVFKSCTNPRISFKVINNKYLLKEKD